MKTTVCLLVIVSHLLLESLVDGRLHIRTLRGSRTHRVKRAWSYPTITIPEYIVEDGTFVTKDVATIKSDNTQVARYEFGDPKFAAFTLETVGDSGTIKQVQPLDREQQASYYLTALALDASGNPVEDPAIIQVVVSDENDNNPIFDQNSLQGVVFENQTSGGFMTLLASDKDSSYREYNKVRFYYVGNEDPPADNPRFSVSEQGVVSVIDQLDAETVPTITFKVEAKDGAVNAKFRSTVEETITVTVGDSNDNAPVFTTSPPYEVTKGELLPVSSAIYEVSTTDSDQGVNKATYYKITSGNPDGTFSMKSYPSQTNDPSRGEIILDKLLDYESGITSYVLTVVAYNKDASNPSDVAYQTSIQVTINVADENEPPIFLNEPYTAKVVENVASVPFLTTVQAVDKDFGETQTVTFSLLNGNGWFDITSDGGISVISAIDRENPLVDQATSIFTLRVKATDNYNPTASSEAEVSVLIGDVNDNAPVLDTQSEHIMVCQYPPKNVSTLTIVDKDTTSNGPPFMYSTNEAGWYLDQMTDYTVLLLTDIKELPLSTDDSFTEVPITITDTATDGSPSMTGTSTVTIQVCRCDKNHSASCQSPVLLNANYAVMIITIVVLILLLLIIVLAVVAYRRRQKADLEKQALFIDDDDVRENLQAYHDEGGGEEDNDGYDISTLTAPPPAMASPRRDDVPLTRAAPQPRNIPPGTDIGDYIADAKDQADKDPTAPPFDSLLVFDYEGQGSDAGSLSSLNSGTTDGSQDYNYLNNWGPRFKKLADMYGGDDDE